jgi:hypothetical protein
MNWFLTIIFFLAAGPLHARPLWNGAESGMHPHEVLKLFAGAVAASDEPDLEGEVEKIRIPSHKYLGREFSVQFFFSKGGLQHVRLDLSHPGSSAEMKKLVEEIVADLSKGLGKPKRSETDIKVSRILGAEWLAPDLEVSVMGLTYGPTERLADVGRLSINYRKPAEKERKPE